MNDLFSRQAATYAIFRPAYPERLVQFVLSSVKNAASSSGKPLLDAYDIGCGNGQVTIPLARTGLFRKVIGMDKSASQLEHTLRDIDIPGLEFKQADALNLRSAGVEDYSCSLLTSAQMLHWMTNDAKTWQRLKTEVVRVLIPNTGRFAVIGYGICRITNDSQIENKLQELYRQSIKENLWDKNCDRLLLDSLFAEGKVDFSPLRVVDRKVFPTTHRMPLDSFVKYVSTWSAFTQDAHKRLFDKFKTDSVITADPVKEVDVEFPFFVVILKSDDN